MNRKKYEYEGLVEEAKENAIDNWNQKLKTEWCQLKKEILYALRSKGLIAFRFASSDNIQLDVEDNLTPEEEVIMRIRELVDQDERGWKEFDYNYEIDIPDEILSSEYYDEDGNILD